MNDWRSMRLPLITHSLLLHTQCSGKWGSFLFALFMSSSSSHVSFQTANLESEPVRLHNAQHTHLGYNGLLSFKVDS